MNCQPVVYFLRRVLREASLTMVLGLLWGPSVWVNYGPVHRNRDYWMTWCETRVWQNSAWQLEFFFPFLLPEIFFATLKLQTRIPPVEYAWHKARDVSLKLPHLSLAFPSSLTILLSPEIPLLTSTPCSESHFCPGNSCHDAPLPS